MLLYIVIIFCPSILVIIVITLDILRLLVVQLTINFNSIINFTCL